MPRIVNDTSLISTRRFQGIVDFIQSRLPTAALAHFHVKAAHPTEDKHMCGRAIRGTLEENPVFPGEVRIYLTAPESFQPRLEQFVPSLPEIELNTWEEELVLVLAHEMRHIHQFYTDLWNQLGNVGCEHDAEAFGYEILAQWRQKNHRCTVKAA